jgi:hypothetical protein
MTAITAFKDVRRQENNIGHLKLAANTTIPEGALVGITSGGLARNAAAGDKVLGVASKGASNQNGKTDDHVEFWTYGVITVEFSGTATQADVAKYVKSVDNATVALHVTGTDAAELVAGRIVEVLTASRVRIALKTV